MFLRKHAWLTVSVESIPTRRFATQRLPPMRNINTLRPRQDGRHFPDDIFKWIFLNENVWISINISLKFVPTGPISNIPTLVQVMAWWRTGDKPLSEPMWPRLTTHICVTLPQWVNVSFAVHQNWGNCRYYTDDIFRCTFFLKNYFISIPNLSKFVPNVPINNMPASMAWCRAGKQNRRRNKDDLV